MIGNGTDIIAVRDNQLVTIPQAEADVTDPNNHWIILRHDDQTYYCIYNMGTGLFLSSREKSFLSAIPERITMNFAVGKFAFRLASSRYLGINASKTLVQVTSNPARFELLDNYYLTPSTALCETLLEQTTPEGITATGIDEVEIEPVLLPGEETSSLSDDIVGVYYYDLQGRRIGYALPVGEPVIAHIILRNGASIVRKIMAK